MTKTNAVASDLRILTSEENAAVTGAFWANVAGGVVGGIAGGVTGFVTSGGSWKSAASGAAAGAIAGGLNPLRGFAGAAMAVRTLHAGAVGGVVGAGVERAMSQ